MTLSIDGYDISKVSIIDDNESVREMYQFPIEELDIDPYLEEGPINDIDRFVNSMSEISQAVICDQNLKLKNYSNFNGAELVSKWYQNKFPAILCSRWEKESVIPLRKYRKTIPVLIDPDELEPDSIVCGFKICLDEYKGKIISSRKEWRTLVRVEYLDRETNPTNPYVNVVIPGWNPNIGISLLLNDFPDSIRERIREDIRLYASVNIGAERHEDLFFDNWEMK